MNVDPHRVFVEEAQLERARSFVEEDKILRVLSDEDKDNAADVMARMMTALDVELLREEVGVSRVKSVDLTIPEFFWEASKTIVILSTRLVPGVEHEACVVDTEQAHQILGYK